MKNKFILIIAQLACLLPIQVNAQNPIIRDIFTADPAPIVYHDTGFLYNPDGTIQKIIQTAKGVDPVPAEKKGKK